MALLALGAGALLFIVAGASHVWSKLQGVNVPSDLATRLDALAAALGQGFVVTSGWRDAAGQASAVKALIDEYNYTWSMVYALYYRDDLVAELESAYPSLSVMTTTVQAQMDRGDYLSVHQVGRAADISKWREPAEGVDAPTETQLAAVVAELGAKLVVESQVHHVEWSA